MEVSVLVALLDDSVATVEEMEWRLALEAGGVICIAVRSFDELLTLLGAVRVDILLVCRELQADDSTALTAWVKKLALAPFLFLLPLAVKGAYSACTCYLRRP
jgi:trans-aconitate methyltransferase